MAFSLKHNKVATLPNDPVLGGYLGQNQIYAQQRQDQIIQMKLYIINNWRAWLRGRIWDFAQYLRRGNRSTLSAVAIYPNGTMVDYGVISRRCVTTAGVNALFSTSSPIGISTFNYHDSGTGTNAEAVGDTALQTAAGPARATGTKSNPSAGTYRSQATITYTATQNITEHGIFSASTSGTLWDRSQFAAIGVVNGSQIAFTYECAANAGG